MSLRDWVVPDEIQSAKHAASELVKVASKTSHFWLKQFVASVLPLVAGGVTAYLVLSKASVQSSPEGLDSVVSSILTLASVLAGFMVTLMLFTGRTTGTSSLTVDQLPRYIDKITYLIFSQAFTLFILIFTSMLCIMWMVISSETTAWSPYIIIFGAVISGFIVLSLLRVILLPFQIYEVHRFELDSIYEEKVKEWEDSLGNK